MDHDTRYGEARHRVPPSIIYAALAGLVLSWSIWKIGHHGALNWRLWALAAVGLATTIRCPHYRRARHRQGPEEADDAARRLAYRRGCFASCGGTPARAVLVSLRGQASGIGSETSRPRRSAKVQHWSRIQVAAGMALDGLAISVALSRRWFRPEGSLSEALVSFVRRLARTVVGRVRPSCQWSTRRGRRFPS